MGLAPKVNFDLPLFVTSVSAGFPSPADDFIEQTLNLNQHLIPHPSATFLLRVSGDSMIQAGIYPGDLVIVDRSLKPVDDSVVVAAVNGDLTLKRMRFKGGNLMLVSDNPAYPLMHVSDEADCVVWGVVSHSVHSVR